MRGKERKGKGRKRKEGLCRGFAVVDEEAGGRGYKEWGCWG